MKFVVFARPDSRDGGRANPVTKLQWVSSCIMANDLLIGGHPVVMW